MSMFVGTRRPELIYEMVEEEFLENSCFDSNSNCHLKKFFWGRELSLINPLEMILVFIQLYDS